MLRGVGGPCWWQPGRAGPAALPRLPSVQPASCSSAPARAGPRPRDQGRAGHSSTSSPFRGGAWRTHLDVFFPGWGSRNRASWLQWPARWQLPWKAGDRGGGEVRAGPAVQAASASVTRFRALRQTLSRHFNEGFIVPLLQNRGKRKAGSCPRRRPGVLVSRCA